MLKVNNNKITKNETKDTRNTRLELNIKGPNINYTAINAIRQCIMSDVPIYAFTQYNFEINTSVFNNNYIKGRIKNMPVWGIDNDINYHENVKLIKPNTNETIMENDDVEIKLDKNKTQNQLTMYINYKNETKENMTVTTHHAKFYYNDKNIPSPYSMRIPIVDLQPEQEFAFSAITTLGTEKEDAIYSPVSICGYKEITDNEYNLFLESRGQLTESRIVHVAIDNIIRRMNKILQLLKNTETTKDNIDGLLNINNEDHTMGNLLTRGLQQHSQVSFAGYKVIHPLDNKIQINYKLKDKNNIYNIMQDVVDYYIMIYQTIKKGA
jgi:DNA-directed RNA polymerase subunit L